MFLSPGYTGSRLIRLMIMAVVVLASAAAICYIRGRVTDPIVLGYWWMANVAVLLCMYAFVDRRRFPTPSRGVGSARGDRADLNASTWSLPHRRDQGPTIR